MRARILLLGVMAIISTACSGTVVMTPLNPDEINANYRAGTDTVGIIVYRAKPVIEVDELTQANVPDPAKAGATIISDNCQPVLSRKTTAIADTDHPYRLHYDHGFLESYTFGATLTSDGILTAINSQSTPDQGKTLQNLASAASSVAGITKLAAEVSKPRCTITPAFFSFEKFPSDEDLKPFNSSKAP